MLFFLFVNPHFRIDAYIYNLSPLFFPYFIYINVFLIYPQLWEQNMDKLRTLSQPFTDIIIIYLKKYKMYNLFYNSLASFNSLSKSEM